MSMEMDQLRSAKRLLSQELNENTASRPYMVGIGTSPNTGSLCLTVRIVEESALKTVPRSYEGFEVTDKSVGSINAS